MSSNGKVFGDLRISFTFTLLLSACYISIQLKTDSYIRLCKLPMVSALSPSLKKKTTKFQYIIYSFFSRIKLVKSETLLWILSVGIMHTNLYVQPVP